MNASRLRAIYKYGAVLSVVGTALAVIAYTVNGQNSVVGLFFGWAGPLGTFYFGGAYLSYTSTYTVVGEELLRGVAWYFGSLLGWTIIVTQTSALSPSPITVFGLPALTALGITLAMVSTRHMTGSDLKVQTVGGKLLLLETGTIALGFVTLYLVLAGEASGWLFVVYLVSIPAGLALREVMKRRYPNAFGADNRS